MSHIQTKPINWLFFDLDDTLWNFTANSEVSLRKLYTISPILRKLFKDIDEFIDIYHVNNSLMWDLYAKGEVSTTQLKVERWRRTLATKTFEVLTAVCEELDRTYLEILAQGQEKLEGIEQMLQRLTRQNLIAVLSNGFSKTQYQKLHFSGLEKYVTRTIVSEEIGVNKPSKEIFDYAIEETGARQPYLMIGDNGETDVYGAMKVGWHAIWFNPKGKVFPVSVQQMQNDGVNPDLLAADVRTVSEMEKAITDFLTKYSK